jgi:hypothetical protein
MHPVLAFGDEDVGHTTSTTVEVRSDVAAPFIEPGGVMSWTNGTQTLQVTARCRRTEWQLLTPEGSFDLHLDSGDQTIEAPTTAVYETEKRL